MANTATASAIRADVVVVVVAAAETEIARGTLAIGIRELPPNRIVCRGVPWSAIHKRRLSE